MAADAEALARVLAVVTIAKRLARPDDALGREARSELTASTAASPEGIELALSEYLEADPTPAELASLVASVANAARCHVVLSSNVSVGALRAIALAVAAAPVVYVKPSRRDPVLARILVRELGASPAFRDAHGVIQEVSAIDPSAGDAVHAYGADDTLAAIARALPGGVSFVAHGTGFGVALVGSDDPLDQVAAALARDVVVFDQRGCLSPRLVIVEHADRARAFVHALSTALDLAATKLPRGRLDAHEAAEIARYVELMRGIGEVVVGKDHVIGLDAMPESIWIGPACRVVHVVVSSHERLAELLGPVAGHITTFGRWTEDELSAALALTCPEARAAKLGEMQHPPFDGPVDRRTSKVPIGPVRFSG